MSDRLDVSEHLQHSPALFPFQGGPYTDLFAASLKPIDPRLGKDSEEVVLKQFRKQSHGEIDILKQKLLERGSVWSKLDNANVAKFFGIDFHHLIDIPTIVLRHYRAGNIMDFIKNHPDVDRLHMVKGIASGIQYLHDQGLIHGGIRGTNVLIDFTVDGSPIPVIADYELHDILASSSYTKAVSIQELGRRRWMAPEMISEGVPSLTADIYAFAMTILQLYTEDIPFASTRHNDQVSQDIQKGQRPDLPLSIVENVELANIIRDCWDQEPLRRPKAHEVSRRLLGPSTRSTQQ